MKYNHLFKLIDSNPSSRVYQSDNNIVRIDFINHILRVAMYKQDAYLFPTFSICPGESMMPRHGRDKLSIEGFDVITPVVNSKDNIDSFTIDDITISINLNNFHIKYERNNEVLVEDRKYISYNFENELGDGVTHYLTRYEDEHIYGLGDKTGNINKNKRHFIIGTSDAMGFDSRSSDPLYKQIPFYICKNNVGSYGIFYDTYANGEMDFGCEINNYYGPFKSFKASDDSLVYYVIFGTTYEVLTRFSYLCGKSMLAPSWSLKYGGSTMAYTDAPNAEEQLRNFVSLCKKYELDCGQFYLSSGYTSIGNQRCVFHWNNEKIKDPKALADYFKENGIEFLPNVKPCFLTTHPLYNFIASKGWFLHYKDGTPATFPFWDGMGSYLDFANDEAFDFWSKCIKEQLVDKGYKNIWNDNNEYDIHDESVYAHGFDNYEIQAIKIKPLFSYLMSLASLQGQDKSSPIMAVSRSGIAGMQRLVQTWTGDNNTSFVEFRGNHKMAMTMSLSSLYFFGQDIGGFAGEKPSKELFIRWIQYGLFTPRFVLHSWNQDGSATMPWLYEDMMDEVTNLFKLRSKLIPYLYETMKKCVEDYKPMIYPIFLKYPDYDEESDCFFVGDDILVCPIFDEGINTVTVNLPYNENGWYCNGKHYESGIVTLTSTIHDLPIFFTTKENLI